MYQYNDHSQINTQGHLFAFYFAHCIETQTLELNIQAVLDNSIIGF